MTHLRKMMLEELQRRNYSENTTRCYIRAVEDFARRFHLPPDRLGPRQIRAYQAELFQKRKLSAQTVATRLAALRFFYTKTLTEGLEHCRNSLPEKGTSPPDDPQPARSRATDRRRWLSPPTHPADDALRHGSAQCRVDSPESQRHRQPAHGDSCTRRQGTQRSRCAAQSQATGTTPCTLASAAAKTQRMAVSGQPPP